MAEAPTVSAPSVTPSTGPLGVNPPAEAFVPAAASLGQTGQVEAKLSDVLAQHAEAFQAVNNALGANAQSGKAITDLAQAREDYRRNFPGMAAADPKNLATYYKTIDDIVAKNNEGLSPLAQEMYLTQTRKYAAQAKDDQIGWASNERKISGNANIDGAMALARATASGSIDNPSAVQDFQKTLGLQGYLKQTLNGWGDDQTREYLQKQTGAVYESGIIQAQASGNLNKAMTLLDKAKTNGYLTDEQTTVLEKGLRTAVHANEIEVTADALLSGKPSPAIPGSHTVDTSRLRDNDSARDYLSEILGGNVPEMGFSGARSVAENRAVNGSPTSEHISGNGYAFDFHPPPGMTVGQAVQKIVDSGVPFDQVINEGNNIHIGWGNGTLRGQILNGAPHSGSAATVVGVAPWARGMAESSSPVRLDPKATPTMNEGYAQAQVFAKTAGIEDPVTRQQVRESMLSKLRGQIQIISGAQDQAFGNIEKAIIDGNITDPAAIMKIDPHSWNAMSPERQAALLREGQSINREKTQEQYYNETMLGVAYAKARTDPQAFLSIDVNSMDLKPNDRKDFLIKQEQVRQNQAIYSESDKSFNRAYRSASFANLAQSLGVDTTDPDASGHLQGLLKGHVDNYIAAKKGAPLSDAEIDREVIPHVARDYAKETSVLGWTGSEEYNTAKESLGLSGNANPTPAEIAEEMVQNREGATLALYRKGVSVPTNAQVKQLIIGKLAEARRGQ